MDDAKIVGHSVRPRDERIKVRWVCGQEDDIDEGAEEEAEHGSRTMKKVQDPREPSKEEREEHDKSHLPYRSWCRHCVRGRGKQMPHYEGAQETSMSEVHMDFGFLGREADATRTISVLVAKERTSKMIMSAATPRKSTGAYIEEGIRVLARGGLHAGRHGGKERPRTYDEGSG